MKPYKLITISSPADDKGIELILKEVKKKLEQGKRVFIRIGEE